EVDVQRLLDAPTDTVDVFRGVRIAPGRDWWTRGQVQYQTSSGRPLSFNTSLSLGGFYDGTSTEAALEATWRRGGHVILGAGFSRARVSLSVGAFTAVQATGRIEYAFDTR